MFLLLFIAAATPWQKNPHSSVRVVADLDVVAAGRDVIDVGVEFTTINHWHVYWRNSGDAGFAPSIIADHSSGIADVEWSWPAPSRFLLKGGLQAFGYESHVVYPARLVLKEPAKKGTLRVAFAVDYLVCEDECVPYRYDFTMSFPVAEADKVDGPTAALLTQARASVPERRPFDFALTAEGDVLTAKLPASADLFFDVHKDFDFGVPTRAGDDLRIPMRAKQAGAKPESITLVATVTGLPDGKAVETEKKISLLPAPVAAAAPPPSADASLWLMLVLGVLGGLLLNLMPCVLPVLSLKLLGLVEHAGEEESARSSALWSSAGIFVSFWALAAAAIGVRAAGHGVGWGVQFQEPVFVAFLAVVVVLFALNLWGVFELPLPERIGRLASVGGRRGPLSHFAAGLFATLLATPCSAPFLGTAVAFALTSSAPVIVAVFSSVALGMSSPYLLLALRPSLIRFVPKPGMWMVRLKQALGFALAATAVWLLFVLSGQLDQTRVAWIELSLLGVGLFAWAVEASKNTMRTVFALSLLAMCGATIALAREAHETSMAVEVVWEPFDEAKLEQHVRNGKRVFVDVTADWCFTCKVNERAVLASSAVAGALIEGGVVTMKADWTKRDEKIGKFLSAHGRTGIPFYMVRAAGRAPLVLPELLTESIVLDALK